MHQIVPMATRGAAVAVGVLGVLVIAQVGGQAGFWVGGALINAGYRLQDAQDAFERKPLHGASPEAVWRELQAHNALASRVLNTLPRRASHPLVAMLVCMDARIDTNELVGDARRNHYVIRTAGSVMSPEEQDMLELAVTNGVKVIVLTRHTDCAAEAVAADPAKRARFPHLAASVDEREARVREFLARPEIARRVASGELLVKEQLIDTASDRLTPSQRNLALHGGD